MGVATARTVTLDGIRGHVIDVQADVRQGLVNTTMVGRPDPTISESRDRCRTAIVNSRFEWPTTRRVTIALSPADLPKRGSHFDLAIALAVLTAGAREEPRIPVGGVGGAAVHRRADPRRSGARRARGDPDGDGGPGPGRTPCRGARPARRRGVPGARRRGGGRPVAGPGGRAAHGRPAARRAAGRAARVRVGAELARRGPHRRARPRRRPRHGRHPLRPGGGRRRRPPPAAQRAEGRRQDDAGRAAPGPAARPQRRGDPRAGGGAVAGRRGAATADRRPATLPGARTTAPPR